MGTRRNRPSKLAQALPAFEDAVAKDSGANFRLVPTDYQPLPSVWDGTDAELLEKMLDFYPKKRPHLILDATVNAGRFWEGSKRKIIGLDIDPRQRRSWSLPCRSRHSSTPAVAAQRSAFAAHE
jgi:hypothetical protein